MVQTVVLRALHRNIYNACRWSDRSHLHFRSTGSRLLQPLSVTHARMNDTLPVSLFTSSSNSDSKQSTTTDADEENLDKPIQFTTSAASKWTASDSLSGDAFPDSPWYQPHVVTLSVAVFLIYFFYLREESDIDEEIDKPLWDKVPSLERQQLQIVLDYNRKHNIDSKDVEERLKQVSSEEAAIKRKIGIV